MLETRKGGRPSRRPDKETLQHLSDMLTIEQIAQLYCVDRSTVCNWKKYYRLPPKIGRPTKRPSARKLRNLCKTCSYMENGGRLGVSPSTVASWVYFYRQKNEKKGVWCVMNDMFLDDIKKDVSVTTYTDTSTSNSKWLVMNCTVHIQIYLSSIKFPGGKVIGRDADLPSVNS